MNNIKEFKDEIVNGKYINSTEFERYKQNNWILVPLHRMKIGLWTHKHAYGNGYHLYQYYL